MKTQILMKIISLDEQKVGEKRRLGVSRLHITPYTHFRNSALQRIVFILLFIHHWLHSSFAKLYQVY